METRTARTGLVCAEGVGMVTVRDLMGFCGKVIHSGAKEAGFVPLHWSDIKDGVWSILLLCHLLTLVILRCFLRICKNVSLPVHVRQHYVSNKNISNQTQTEDCSN